MLSGGYIRPWGRAPSRGHSADEGARRNGGPPEAELSTANAAEVHRFVARRVANRADAADIAQQALLLAWAKRSSFRGATISAWLLTIARHLIVDHYRARGRVRFVALEALVETEPALRTRPDAVAVLCDCRARLRTWLECLTQRLRLEEQVAVLLADVYGHRDKDSAALLRMNLPSFKLLLHGSRARLHEIAGGRCALVRSDACRAPANGPCADSSCGDGRASPGAPNHRLGVICGLHATRLQDLQRKLLAGLNLGAPHPQVPWRSA